MDGKRHGKREWKRGSERRRKGNRDRGRRRNGGCVLSKSRHIHRNMRVRIKNTRKRKGSWKQRRRRVWKDISI